MPKLYLHIGTLKTGTTSIQSFLTHNRENLLRKGYLYPTSGTGKGNLHIRFCQTILSRRSDNPLTNNWIGEWKNLKREIDLHQPDRVVVSCEGFSALERDEVKLLESDLSRYLRGSEIKIIVYLRQQDNLLVSLYAQRIKTAMYWGSFQDFYKEGILFRNGYTYGLSHIREFRFDYYELLKPWAEIFGKDNILVRRYDRDLGKKEDLINDFLKTIDFSSTGEDLQYLDINKNRNVSGKTIKIIRLLTYIAREKLFIPWDKCKNSYIKRILSPGGKTRKILKLIERLPDFILSNELASDEMLCDVLENFEDANCKVAQHYLGSAKLF